MHDRADLVFGEGSGQQLAISDIAHDQRGIADRLAKPGRQIVQHHDPLAAVAQLQDHVAADIARATRDQHGILDAHRLSRPKSKVRTPLMITVPPRLAVTDSPGRDT